MSVPRKKLIEVALPLEAINEEGSRRKRKAPAGYPTTLHKWWAQRPVAAARAVIFAQMVDDPSSYPDLFPTERAQDKERRRLFRVIEELVKWDNTGNEEILQQAREEIWQSWRRACAEHADHGRAADLFDRQHLPPFCDPFAGSGAIPLEAQRLGLEAHASDLNPVAVFINKAMIELPPRFSGRAPVNAETRKETALFRKTWSGAQGIAEDLRHYGRWMRHEAERRIGHLYPKVEVTPQLAKMRADLSALVGRKLTVTACLWVRTVKSPNPAFAHVDVPLASTFMLSTGKEREAYILPVIEKGGYHFTVRLGRPEDIETAGSGTKLARGANFACLMSGTPISGDYIKAEAKAGRMGARLMAIVAEADRKRVYLPPTTEAEAIALSAGGGSGPEVAISGSTQYLGVKPYGIERFDQLFTARQLAVLATFSDLVQESVDRVKRDAVSAGVPDDGATLSDGGGGATAYGHAIAVYLATALSRVADYGSSLATWRPKDNAMRSSLPKQALQMTWDFAEGSPFGASSAGFEECVAVVARALEASSCAGPAGVATQRAASELSKHERRAIISTDPPYYDNVPYADLSDFFYVWLRRSLRTILPDLFATVAAPKTEELVAFAHRHGGKPGAEAFFLRGMTAAMKQLAESAHPGFPVTIYYAFRQSEQTDGMGIASTGWDTFLGAVIGAGLTVTGTWPMRTEGDNRQRGVGSNALASSIVLVCRPRTAGAPTANRREFITALKSELPVGLAHLQRSNIAPVDLAQAAIGPGMAVFTRYAEVLDAAGNPMTVREALILINETLEEVLTKQEGDFDSDSRWALAWFDEIGFKEGPYGKAEQLSKSKNTSVAGMIEAGILVSKSGKARLLSPDELPADWDPATDQRLTAWEMVHHLIRALEADGEGAAAGLVKELGSKAEIARELAYRLYSICERKKRAAEARSYNGLVQSWPEITRLAREGGAPKAAQMNLEDLES